MEEVGGVGNVASFRNNSRRKDPCATAPCTFKDSEEKESRKVFSRRGGAPVCVRGPVVRTRSVQINELTLASQELIT